MMAGFAYTSRGFREGSIFLNREAGEQELERRKERLKDLAKIAFEVTQTLGRITYRDCGEYSDDQIRIQSSSTAYKHYTSYLSTVVFDGIEVMNSSDNEKAFYYPGDWEQYLRQLWSKGHKRQEELARLHADQRFEQEKKRYGM